MKIYKTNFHGLIKIIGQNHYDKRGYFRELYKNKIFKNKIFKFWCISKSIKNVVRGLHIQQKVEQDIIVSVIKGKIFDVALDLRKKSNSYGKHSCNILSDKNSTSLFIPAGFAHGFCSLEKENLILYGLTNLRSEKDESGVIWNDKTLNIKWPVKNPIISKKDKKNISFNNFVKK
jgi:dTDP-4-dehydrorhamnose 3,5-epimerase